MSLIFVTNAIGFISAAFFVDALRARLGRAKTLMVAQTMMSCGYIPIVCTPPFPLVVFSFFLLGLGMAINLAMGNTFAVNLHNGTKMLGAMHGSYGVGGTIGPLSKSLILELRLSLFPSDHELRILTSILLYSCDDDGHVRRAFMESILSPHFVSHIREPCICRLVFLAL